MRWVDTENLLKFVELLIYIGANYLLYRAIIATYRLRHKDKPDEEDAAD